MNNPTPHIVRAFDQELAALSGSIEAMGNFAAKQFTDSVHALLGHDLDCAQNVIDEDRELDVLRRDVSTAAATVITKRQPIAGDLNEVLADLRVAEDLERVGDLAKNTAKRAIAIANRTFPPDIIQQLKEFANEAATQLRAAIAAYVRRDALAALATRVHDEQLDRLHTKVFRELVARTSGDQGQVVGFVHLLFCAKNIERVGDHSAHIADAAHLLATGHLPEGERRRLDVSSSITGDALLDAAFPEHEDR